MLPSTRLGAMPQRRLSILGVALLTFAVAAARTDQAHAQGAAELYAAACVVCHGPAGKGLAADDPRLPTFDPPPADLSDPEFSSAEPARDWSLVIKHGGPSLGLSAQMPAFGEVLSDEQIEGLVAYVKGLASGTERYANGEMNLARPVLTKKPFPEDEALLVTSLERRKGATPDAPDQDVGKTVQYFGMRVGPRGQAEVKLVEAFKDGEAELDEVEVGWKHVLAQSARYRALLSGGLELSLPFELDHERPGVHAYLAVAKPVGRRLQVHASAQYSHGLPLGDAPKGPSQLAAGTSLFLPLAPYKRGLYPGVEARSVSQFGTGAAATYVTATPQVLAKLSRRGHVAFSLGAELPIVNAPFRWKGHAILIWEFGEGPPWEGW